MWVAQSFLVRYKLTHLIGTIRTRIPTRICIGNARISQVAVSHSLRWNRGSTKLLTKTVAITRGTELHFFAFAEPAVQHLLI